jgi:TolB protein
MSNNRHRMSVVSTMLVFLGGCGGASTAGAPSSTPTLAGSAATTQGTVRPGYILLEHFGNAADGTPLADGQHHLWLIKADGSDLHELAPGQPDTILAGPRASGYKGKQDAAWSPDGIHIAFETESDPATVIYETDANGATPRLVSTECGQPASGCGDRYPAYSPDGKLLAFNRRIFEPDPSGVIAIRELTTGKVTVLESTRQGPPSAELGRPAWSPDGKQIAYYVVPKNDILPTGASQIFIVNADGTGLHQLATPGLAVGDPSWSPDGSLIVFSTTPIHEWSHLWAHTNALPHPNIYVVRPDGTGLRQLTADFNSGAPSWTTDGKIFYSDINDHEVVNKSALWLMDADGSNPIRIGPGKMDLLSPVTGYTYYAYWQPMP